MSKSGTTSSSVYTAELIDLVRLGVALATLLERGGSPREVRGQLLQLLPRVYAQTLLLPSYFYDWEEDFIEEYITEEAYEEVRERLAATMGSGDAFLVPQLTQATYGEESVQLTISECLADVYQHLGNLLGIIKEENTEAVPAAIGRYLLYWREHWGRQLLLALTALHQIHTSNIEEEEDETEDEDYETDEAQDILAYLEDETEDEDDENGDEL